MQEYEVQAAGHDKKECFHAPLTKHTTCAMRMEIARKDNP